MMFTVILFCSTRLGGRSPLLQTITVPFRTVLVVTVAVEVMAVGVTTTIVNSNPRLVRLGLVGVKTSISATIYDSPVMKVGRHGASQCYYLPRTQCIRLSPHTGLELSTCKVNHNGRQ